MGPFQWQSVGEVGVIMASTDSNAFWKSLRIRVRHFLGFQIVGIIVAATENISAKNRMALNLFPKTQSARLMINIDRVLAVKVLSSRSIANSVVPGQIG